VKAAELFKLLAPFQKMVDKKAMVASYRALMLTNDYVRGNAPFGIMEIEVDLNLGRDINIDGEEFLSVIKSLPNAELELSVKDTKLVWECGHAKGQLALMGDNIEIPELPDEIEPDDELEEGFSEALIRGSLSAGGAHLLSAGLFGAVIANTDDGLYIYGSDDPTVSSARLGDTLPGSVERCALSPEAITMLGLIANEGGALLAFDEKVVYCNTETTRLVLNQISPPKHDVKELAENFTGPWETTALLDHDTISTFIKRAEALSTDGNSPFVAISIENGQARLAFESGKNSSEEYYIVEGGSDISVAPIVVEAKRMSKALSFATHLVFDHAEDDALVLSGENEFLFVISGKKPD